MSKERLVIAACGILMSGCATHEYDPTVYVLTYGPEPTAEQVKSARSAMFACFYRNAPSVDDGVSDARTVGRSLSGICSKESNEYARVRTWPLTDTQRRDFYAGWATATTDLATTAVLQGRAANK